MSSGQQAVSPKALTSRDRDYLALIMAMTTEFRQLTRLKLITTIQRASPPGIMGTEAILKAQEEARQAAIALSLEKQRQEDEESDDSESDSGSDNEDNSHQSAEAAEAAETPDQPTIYGYVPPPALVHHIIPGTQATPLAMSAYMQYVFDQMLDEMALKEGILEALETISQLKDSGEDDLPPLLDQQLTNLVLLWELEPYLETVPERNEVEAALGVVSWQMEKVK
ncbi:hypothetical protein BGZ72_010576 [Mortierella alpina]|nr:hypothetical protein BGZ72_010576 [Mortierella alpina]